MSTQAKAYVADIVEVICERLDTLVNRSAAMPVLFHLFPDVDTAIEAISQARQRGNYDAAMDAARASGDDAACMAAWTASLYDRVSVDEMAADVRVGFEHESIDDGLVSTDPANPTRASVTLHDGTRVQGEWYLRGDGLRKELVRVDLRGSVGWTGVTKFEPLVEVAT